MSISHCQPGPIARAVIASALKGDTSNWRNWITEAALAEACRANAALANRESIAESVAALLFRCRCDAGSTPAQIIFSNISEGKP